MGSSVFPAASAASKTRYVVTLTSGTSWTVPAGCLYVNARLIGGGGGSGASGAAAQGGSGGNTTFTGATTATGGTGGSGTSGQTTTATRKGEAGIMPYIPAGSGGPAALGYSGDDIETYLTTTPAASIAYAIGAGGTGTASIGYGAGGSGAGGKIVLEYWA